MKGNVTFKIAWLQKLSPYDMVDSILYRKPERELRKMEEIEKVKTPDI